MHALFGCSCKSEILGRLLGTFAVLFGGEGAAGETTGTDNGGTDGAINCGEDIAGATNTQTRRSTCGITHALVEVMDEKDGAAGLAGKIAKPGHDGTDISNRVLVHAGDVAGKDIKDDEDGRGALEDMLKTDKGGGHAEVERTKLEFQVGGRIDATTLAQQGKAILKGAGGRIQAIIENAAGSDGATTPSGRTRSNGKGKVKGEEGLAGRDLAGEEIDTTLQEHTVEQPARGRPGPGAKIAGGETGGGGHGLVLLQSGIDQLLNLVGKGEGLVAVDGLEVNRKTKSGEVTLTAGLEHQANIGIQTFGMSGKGTEDFQKAREFGGLFRIPGGEMIAEDGGIDRQAGGVKID